MITTVRTIKKVFIFMAGVTVLICGLILLVIPGPGLLVIVAGLVILSLEFEWAKRYLHKARTQLDKVKEKVKNR